MGHWSDESGLHPLSFHPDDTVLTPHNNDSPHDAGNSETEMGHWTEDPDSSASVITATRQQVHQGDTCNKPTQHPIVKKVGDFLSDLKARKGVSHAAVTEIYQFMIQNAADIHAGVQENQFPSSKTMRRRAKKRIPKSIIKYTQTHPEGTVSTSDHQRSSLRKSHFCR